MATWALSDATSDYHGLLLSVNKRFGRGFQFQTSYTISKSTDDSSSWTGGNEFGSADQAGYRIRCFFHSFVRPRAERVVDRVRVAVSIRLIRRHCADDTRVYRRRGHVVEIDRSRCLHADLVTSSRSR